MYLEIEKIFCDVNKKFPKKSHRKYKKEHVHAYIYTCTMCLAIYILMCNVIKLNQNKKRTYLSWSASTMKKEFAKLQPEAFIFLSYFTYNTFLLTRNRRLH